MTEDFRPKSDFLRTLMERGYVHQCSDFAGVDDKARAGELTTYIGFDCTAQSLHVGSLLPIMMLHWLQKTGGGKPMPMMGGGTTRIGDPSGRDEGRQLLSVETIDANKAEIAAESTPDFAKRYDEMVTALRDIVIAGKGVATATTIHAATESLDEHSATVIAFVDQSVTNVTAPKGNQQRYRMVVTLAREGDRWLVSNVETL